MVSFGNNKPGAEEMENEQLLEMNSEWEESDAAIHKI